MMQAILGNAAHPEYGVATIPFPIPRAEYANCVALLEALEIGGTLVRDCQVQEIRGPWPALKRLEEQLVNLDELDYLAKRLDSFSSGELAQFQALAEKWELQDMTDLINLSFCCQEATVITDFSDLEAVGRRHYLNTHGSCAFGQEWEDLDARETALLLIDSGAGTVTPYGVVYDNGVRLEPVYDGHHLPCFTYAPAVLTVALSSRLEPDNVSQITWLYLPTDEEQLHRALLRSGIADPADFHFRLEDSVFPAAVEAVLDVQLESIYELNRLAQFVDRLQWDQRMKLGAVAAMAEPVNARQLRQLAENLDQFEFAPGVRSPEEYGRYLIRDSGYFAYDPNLEDFYDYEKYGLQRMAQEQGCFTEQGYLACQSEQNLDELLWEGMECQKPAEPEMQMGGWCSKQALMAQIPTLR